ncbi:MAG: TIGR01212 family radical SAM protein [Alistipes sp.]|nr:TIGR01212 family radical SAM protein [Alistipes sp.]
MDGFGRTPVEAPQARYNRYSDYFRRLFGGRVQKLSIDAGFTCPNRDGTISSGGCTFCNNSAFTPSYCRAEKSITQQIEEGIEFHRRRYREASRYLAYFQAYSNTYADTGTLRSRYCEALAHPLVAGIAVGTRPDCIDAEKCRLLAELAREAYVTVELGIESVYDKTLRAVNRGHDFAAAQRAAEMVAAAGLPVGAHFIVGLPGESDEMILAAAERINSLPLTTVKFHQLQIMRGTAMAELYDRDPGQFRLRGPEEYIELMVELLRRLRPDTVVERVAGEAPPRFRHTEGWGSLRNETVTAMFERRLEQRDVRQGDLFSH